MRIRRQHTAALRLKLGTAPVHGIYATDLARRIATLNPRRVLETAALPKADIQNLACTGAVTLAALISPSSPAGVVTEQLGLNIDGYLRDRPIYRRPREHSQS